MSASVLKDRFDRGADRSRAADCLEKSRRLCVVEASRADPLLHLRRYAA
jgi:hypothetical protein